MAWLLAILILCITFPRVVSTLTTTNSGSSLLHQDDQESLPDFARVLQETAGSCNGKPKSFENRLRVELTGMPENITASEKRTLEIAFKKTYKQLTRRVPCIAGSRDIKKVTIEQDSFDRASGSGHQGSFLYEYLVQGDCTCCEANASFFDLEGAEFDLDGKGKLWRKWKQQNKQNHQKELDATTTCQDKRSRAALCKCASIPPPVFADLYNEIVKILQKRDKLNHVDTVQAVADAVTDVVTDVPKDDCTKGWTFFEADVAVRHRGDPEYVDSERQDALKRAFMDSYNKVNTPNDNACDPFHLIIDQVSIVDDGTFYKNQATWKGSFTVLYRAQGKCRDCDSRPKLFHDEDSNTRKLSPSPSLVSRNETANDDVCTCPESAKKRSPTVQDFESAFNENVINSPELIGIIYEVSVASEVKPIECLIEDRSLFTEISLLLQTEDPSIPGVYTTDLKDIALLYGKTYNELATQYCIPYLRFIEHLEIVKPDDSGRELKRKKKRNRFKFKVTGSGRKRKAELGEDGSASWDPTVEVRRKLFGGSRRKMLREGKSYIDTCFCPINPVADRAPTTKEFIVPLQEAISAAAEDGTLLLNYTLIEMSEL